VAVTENKIGAGGDHQFSLTAKLGQDGPSIYGQSVKRPVTSPTANPVTPVKGGATNVVRSAP